MVLNVVLTVILFLKLCILYTLGNIVVRIPCLKPVIVKQMNRVASIIMPVENYYHTLFSWSVIQTLWKYGRYEIRKSSKVGRVAPNPRLVFAGQDGAVRQARLLDLGSGARPLVVVFGSCTCPVVIAKLDKLHQMQRDFCDVADFVMIYLQEAHPDDGWRMKNNYEIRKHVSIEDRLKAAQSFQSLLAEAIPVYSDTMENEACIAYSGGPNRILVIEGDVLTYQNGPGPTSFNFDGVRQHLQKSRQTI